MVILKCVLSSVRGREKERERGGSKHVDTQTWDTDADFPWLESWEAWPSWARQVGCQPSVVPGAVLYPDSGGRAGRLEAEAGVQELMIQSRG